MAKYQAHDPPTALFTFELATTWLLPSYDINTTTGRGGGNGGVLLGGKVGGKNLGSILNKGVHIATPAEWPPPSGMLKGKEGSNKIIKRTIICPYISLPPFLMYIRSLPKSVGERRIVTILLEQKMVVGSGQPSRRLEIYFLGE